MDDRTGFGRGDSRVHEGQVDLTPSKHAKKEADFGVEIGGITIAPRLYKAEDVTRVMENVFERIREMKPKGQHEYVHDNDRPFRNFEDTAKEMNTSREVVLFIMMKKHWDGIVAYINGHQSQREPISSRFTDLHLYLILLEAMYWEQHPTIEFRGPFPIRDRGREEEGK